MALNPYLVLGTTKDASISEIKFCYYMKAKKCHPDVGGNANEFALLKFCYDVLKDKKKRKLYDEEGYIENNPDPAINQVVMDYLKQLFLTTIHKVDPREIEYFDIVGNMKNTINNNINSLNSQITKLQSSETTTKAALVILEKKFKRKGNKNNFLIELLKESLNGIPAQLLNFQHQLNIQKEMLALLAEFSYKFDYKQQNTATYTTVVYHY